MQDDTDDLALAMKCAEDGDIKKAREICDGILTERPKNIEARHFQAYLFILMGEFETAISKLLHIVGDHPDNPDIISTLAAAYIKSGDQEKGLSFLRRILQLKPNDVEALTDLATIHAEAGHLKAAIGYCTRALEASPDHSRANQLNKALDEHLFKLHVDPINQFVPDDIGRGKPKVIVPLRLIGRIGHLIIEPFLLKCIYDPAEYDIIFVIPPRTFAVSQPVFEVSFRDLFFVEDSQDPQMAAYNQHGKSIGTYQSDDRTIVLESIADLMAQAVDKARDGQFSYHAVLTEGEMAGGMALRNAMGIPADAKIVTLYVRDSGFFPGIEGHGIRNSNIDNYVPAIKHLVDKGYYVVRLGDNKMTPLPDLGKQVIDAPFHPAYTQLVEPYFVSQSDFMLKTPSGPEALSLIFAIPSVYVNAMFSPIFLISKDDLSIFKSYYSHRYERNLSLREIAYDKEILFSCTSDSFAREQIELHENTQEDILNVTIEMTDRMDGIYNPTPSIDERFNELCQQINKDCNLDTSDRIYGHLEIYSFLPYLMNGQISHEFCKSHSELLS
jgi:putative glycosyltransferase (TIGR04372 family)